MKKSTLLLVAFFCLLKTLCAQNVGIGLTNPTKAKLEVYGTNSGGNTSGIFGTDGAGISLQRNVPAVGFNEYHFIYNKYIANGYAAIQFLDHINGGMHFDLYASGVAGSNVPAGLRALTLHPNGNVGIRGGGSQASLTVARGSGFGGTAMFSGTTNTSHFNYDVAENTFIRAGKNGSDVYINDIPGGNVFLGSTNTKVGINTATPVYTLEVKQVNNRGIGIVNADWGPQTWGFMNEKSNTDVNNKQTVLTLLYTGRSNNLMGWFNNDDGSYHSNSDARLKDNITTLEPVLDKVLKLRPARYKFKAQDAPYAIGFLAQEAKLLFPETVSIHQNDEGAWLPQQHGMNYGSFGVIAIRAIQEQQQLLDDKQKQIDELKARLDRLEKILAKG